MSNSPKGLNWRRVRAILRAVSPVHGIGARMAEVSRQFLGCPYVRNPLIGSCDRAEVFTVSLAGFDCVTYVETVLALARAHTPEVFVENLRNIRYVDGIVMWTRRNHYMTQWIRNNQRAGFVRDRTTRGSGTVERRRHLDRIDGLPETNIRVRSIPKRAFMRRSNEIRTGDLAFFASTHRNLDVFHCGILLEGDVVLLRHAPLSRGRVVDQPLIEFLDANRMSGVILARPLEGGPSASE